MRTLFYDLQINGDYHKNHKEILNKLSGTDLIQERAKKTAWKLKTRGGPEYLFLISMKRSYRKIVKSLDKSFSIHSQPEI